MGDVEECRPVAVVNSPRTWQAKGVGRPYLVHFSNDGDEEPRVEIPFVDEALDQRDELCAGSAVLGEDSEDAQGQGLGTRRERSE